MNSIYVTGLWRSGTTLVLRLFDGHPSLCVMPTETGIISVLEKNSNFVEELKSSSNPIQMLCLIAQNGTFRFKDLVDGSVRGMSFSQTKNFYPFEFDFDLFAKTYFNCLQKAVSVKDLVYGYYESINKAWKNQQFPSKVRSGFAVQRAHRRTKYPGEDPVRFIMENIDDMTVVEMCRHPVWQINSAMRTGEASLEQAIVDWAFAASDLIAKKEQYLDRYLVVKLEELVRDVRSTMEVIAKASGLEMHDSLLSPTFNGQEWKGNSLFGDKKNLEMTNRLNLPVAQVNYIRKSLFHYMEKLGYESV